MYENISPNILTLINRQNILASSLKRVPTAHSFVLFNDKFYIKECTADEIKIIELLYPGRLIDSICNESSSAFITKNLGNPISETDFTNKNLSLWIKQVDNFWHKNTTGLNIKELDVQQEIDFTYAKLVDINNTNIAQLVKELLNFEIHQDIDIAHKNLSHGDLNFRNIVFDKNQTTAHLIDFDKTTIAPIEWDLSKMYMVCLIANRHDLYEILQSKFPKVNTDLLNYFLAIQLAQTIIHAVTYIDFETEAGLNRRLEIAKDFLKNTSQGFICH